MARSLGLALWGTLRRPIVLREPPYHLWEFRPRPLARLAAAVGFKVVSQRQSKIPPGSVHGDKSGLQRAVMAVIDAINVPITSALNIAGDRITMIGRTPPPAPASADFD